MKKNIFLVVGLGVLGNSVARTLSREGAEVIAVDKDPEAVEEIKDSVEVAVQLDSTDAKALKQLGVENVDAAVVCIGERFETAILATANLLDLGVKHVKARANNQLAASILRRLGAHDVFFVESTMGKVIAHKLTQPELSQEMDIGGGYRIIQWDAPDAMTEQSLIDLSLPKRFRVQVIAIRRTVGEGGRTIEIPTGETKIKHNDQLLLAGHERDLTRFFDYWKKQ